MGRSVFELINHGFEQSVMDLDFTFGTPQLKKKKDSNVRERTEITEFFGTILGVNE